MPRFQAVSNRSELERYNNSDICSWNNLWRHLRSDEWDRFVEILNGGDGYSSGRDKSLRQISARCKRKCVRSRKTHNSRKTAQHRNGRDGEMFLSPCIWRPRYSVTRCPLQYLLYTSASNWIRIQNYGHNTERVLPNDVIILCCILVVMIGNEVLSTAWLDTISIWALHIAVVNNAFAFEHQECNALSSITPFGLDLALSLEISSKFTL